MLEKSAEYFRLKRCAHSAFPLAFLFSDAGIGVLVPHANGAGNDLLVGRYLQLGVIFYTFLGFPGAILWTFMTEKAVLWFDFDQETATIGQQYAYTLVIYLFLEGFMACFTEFLNTLDHENYATVASIVAHGTQSVVISVLAVVGVKDLVVIGLSQIAVGILEIIVNLTIMTRKGWLDDYWEGIFRTNGLKVGLLSLHPIFTFGKMLRLDWLTNSNSVSSEGSASYSHAFHHSNPAFRGLALDLWRGT